MNGVLFHFADQTLTALPSGALWWQAAKMLCVSDLHLGKSERIARRGGTLLPPFETRDTLGRLSADIAEHAPATVICLGDSFDDLTAATALSAPDRATLETLMATRDWIWVEGNHDSGPPPFGGTSTIEWRQGPLKFRHISDGTSTGEVSGHYHPKARIAGRARACFLMNDARLILPAYGTYTGGLACTDAALAAILRPSARAILTGKTMVTIPVHYPR